MSGLPAWRRPLAEGPKILARPEVALGGIAFSAGEACTMIGRGYRFIVLGSDAGLLAGAAQPMVQAIRA